MMGLPTETLDEIEQTIQFALELPLDMATFTLFLPLPGTLDYTRALKSGKFPNPTYYLDSIQPEINFPATPFYTPDQMTDSELLSIHKKAFSRFFFRPSFVIRQLLTVRSTTEILSMAKGGLTLIQNALFRTTRSN
jgi:radical SAM superfamily enzyme YgiQ (UPF0313 family)